MFASQLSRAKTPLEKCGSFWLADVFLFTGSGTCGSILALGKFSLTANMLEMARQNGVCDMPSTC